MLFAHACMSTCISYIILVLSTPCIVYLATSYYSLSSRIFEFTGEVVTGWANSKSAWPT